MKQYKYFLFDMDGTLIDSIPIILESFQCAVFEVYGTRETDTEILKDSIGLPLQESFAHYPQKDQPFLQKAYIKANDELQANGVPLFNGVKETLLLLKEKGANLGVVTSKRLSPTLHLMKVMKLDSIFEEVVGKEDTEKHKPDGEPILECMKRMNIINKDEVLYIGDAMHDLLCAKNAGVDSAIVDWTKMDKKVLNSEMPTLWLRKADDLLELLK